MSVFVNEYSFLYCENVQAKKKIIDEVKRYIQEETMDLVNRKYPSAVNKYAIIICIIIYFTYPIPFNYVAVKRLFENLKRLEKQSGETMEEQNLSLRIAKRQKRRQRVTISKKDIFYYVYLNLYI